MALYTEYGYEVSDIYLDEHKRVCLKFIDNENSENSLILTRADLKGLLDNWVGSNDQFNYVFSQ